MLRLGLANRFNGSVAERYHLLSTLEVQQLLSIVSLCSLSHQDPEHFCMKNSVILLTLLAFLEVEFLELESYLFSLLAFLASSSARLFSLFKRALDLRTASMPFSFLQILFKTSEAIKKPSSLFLNTSY